MCLSVSFLVELFLLLNTEIQPKITPIMSQCSYKTILSMAGVVVTTGYIFKKTKRNFWVKFMRVHFVKLKITVSSFDFLSCLVVLDSQHYQVRIIATPCSHQLFNIWGNRLKVSAVCEPESMFTRINNSQPATKIKRTFVLKQI